MIPGTWWTDVSPLVWREPPAAEREEDEGEDEGDVIFTLSCLC